MRFTFLLFTALTFSACNNTSIKQSEQQTAASKPTATAPEILAKKQVPILCYHQIRAWRAPDSESTKDYVVAPETFKEHIKMLADSGYTSILPDQLYEYLSLGKALPKKPVMITFDDTDVEQFTLAAPELKKYGFKGVFFIMTVSIGRPRYMSSDQIKALSEAGHVIGSHSWDHQNFKKYTAEDWITQVDKPTKRLEEITGKKISYFAYPFGLWNAEGIPELKKRGFKTAFQLSAKRDEKEPLYTIRRNIASGKWNAKTLYRIMINNF
jgi:peptidoglycan/xylan/chitin deacetylase (PgdA/CDA1 family)